ncbi:MAG TPA: hypothetical protein DCQ64_05425 [Candidatus Rokubacteria bacterium]|nr:hypothetical protein [Candidatus Rokubacteria bacterium]
MELGDFSGQGILEAMAAEEMPSIRLLAAEGLASQQDHAWTSLVRDLAGSPDPEVRAAAARLIAKQDPELARSVLDALLSDANPALQELAAMSYGDVVAASDLPTLRRLMRQPSRLTRVRAAGQILVKLRS